MTTRHTIGPWRFTWEGGRLADVAHAAAPDTALDCIDTGGYDWQSGKNTATAEDFRQACREWVGESSADYERELPFLI